MLFCFPRNVYVKHISKHSAPVPTSRPTGRAGRADARVSGNVPATSGFSFAAPKVMVLAGQMFPPLFSLKITFSLNLHSLSDCTKTTISQWNQIISDVFHLNYCFLFRQVYLAIHVSGVVCPGIKLF